MSIKRFKTFEEAREDLWNFYPDSEWIKSVFRVFSFSKFGNKRPVRKGIRRFKTFKDAEEENG